MSKTIPMVAIDALVRQLYKIIISSNFNPDGIVYIERAGKLIGEPLAAKLRIRALGIKANRSGGELKRTLSKYLFFIPKPIIQKIKYLELKSNFNGLNKNRNIVFNDNLNGFKRIIVVDDAIDSGETVKKVIEHINSIDSEVTIKIAVITTTTKKPVINPDFFVYENTICNFPWSIDSEYYEQFIEKYGEYYR